ncbi:hypothetical protein RCL1_008073 [Eukaryota sp. TZLM3-RCL]
MSAKDKAVGARFNIDLSTLDNPSKVRVHVLAKNLPETAPHQDYLLDLCTSNKLTRSEQVVEACKLVTSGFDLSTPEQKEKFEKFCGVNVSYTDEEVNSAAASVLPEFPALLTERYAFNTAPIREKLLSLLPWVDGRQLKQALDTQIAVLIGPLTSEEKSKLEDARRLKDKLKAKVVKPTPPPSDDLTTITLPAVSAPRFASPASNPHNTPENLAAHLKRTGGRVITRFPPEPNGYLHIGHAKSMCLNFGEAEKTGGECILRFDDTNPEAEKEEYFQGILDNVAWLGFKPSRITYSSDYFPRLYEDAIELIKRGKAYVDDLTSEEFAKLRESRTNSPNRDRSVEENLALFERMRQGCFKEGEVVLRMKMDMTNDNPCMRDLVAYRIKYSPHPRSGDTWCIYPSYDFTHCLVDSYEDITHSLCTLEFEIRRDSYYWLLNALDRYCPVVWEFSRLNIYGALMSKRRINKLIREKILSSYDDPRLYTLTGLRRRGVTPSMIKHFCELASVSRGSNTLRPALIDHVVRSELDPSALRRLVVLEPVKVVVDDTEVQLPAEVEIPNHPKDASMGSRKVAGGNVVFIDKSDWKERDEPNYYRMAPGKIVRLRNLGVVRCESFTTDHTGKVTIKATSLPAETKCKGTIHWVSAVNPVNAEVRVYASLFPENIDNPGELPDHEWMSLIDKDSCKIYSNAMAESSFGSSCVGDRVQFERIGFFVCNSVKPKPLFESIVMLKQDI